MKPVKSSKGEMANKKRTQLVEKNSRLSNIDLQKLVKEGGGQEEYGRVNNHKSR